jgi:hypothetical protein
MEAPEKKTPVLAPVKKPCLEIQKVYLKGNSLHVVIRNTGDGRVRAADYAKARLYVSPQNGKIPWSWSLAEVDPKRTCFSMDVDFDTEKALTGQTSITVWLKDVPSGDEWEGVLFPRGVSFKKKAAEPKPPSTLEKPRQVNRLKLAQKPVAKSQQPRDLRPTPSDSSGSSSPTTQTLSPSAPGAGAAVRLGKDNNQLRSTDGDERAFVPELNADPEGRKRVLSKLMEHGALSSPLDAQGSIESVSPQPVEVGGDLTIKGSDFGEHTGTVSIAFAGSTMIDCRVESWHDDRIVVTIPEFVEQSVGERTTSARLWVLALGRDLGPDRRIRVSPNETRLAPVVETVSPASIRPGRIIYVNGRNFLSRGPDSRVDFRFMHPDTGAPMVTHSGMIDNWGDTSIAVRLPEDLRGFYRENPFEMEIRNNAGNMATSPPCTLIPNLETAVITSEEQEFYSSAPGNCYNRDRRHREYRAFQGKRLLNGWQVVSAEVFVTCCACAADAHHQWDNEGHYIAGDSCDAWLASGIGVGTNNPEVDVALFFKPDRVRTVVEVTIEGPVGIPYE